MAEALGPDLKSQYSEGCGALRHYSLCVLNLRIVAIAQGLLLLGAGGALLKQSLLGAAAVVAAFGLLFTAVLWAIQRSYWTCFDAIFQAVIEIEKRGAPGLEHRGPWNAYASARRTAYEQTWWKLLVRHAPYALLALAFALELAATLL
jgi:hypothetical protein